MRRQITTFGILCSLVLALAGLWITAPAAGGGLSQLDPTAQQATVDAAIQTLFAQTAEGAPDMTQTVAAAFSAAQTATAAALPPTPVPVDALQAVEVIDLPLLAGPVNTAAYLAPDGERIAYITRAMACTLDIDNTAMFTQTLIAAGEVPEGSSEFSQSPDRIPGAACVALENVGRFDQEIISWSPDGRYLVMTENFFRFFKDADLWVLDTETMTLTDITNDEQDDYPISDEASNLPPVDVCPRWLADGRLVFLRYGDDQTSPYLYTVQPDGSDLQQIGQIKAHERFSVYALAVSADNTLAYNLWVHDEPYLAQSGVWISNLDGSDPRQVWHNADQPERVPSALEWSPDGQYIALNTPDGSYDMKYEPATSSWRAVRVSDGQTVYLSADQFVWSAGWSPDGSALVYTTGEQMPGSESMGLYIAAGPGAPGRMLLSAWSDSGEPNTALIGTTPRQNQVIAWAADGTVMVTHGGQPSLLIIRLGVP